MTFDCLHHSFFRLYDLIVNVEEIFEEALQLTVQALIEEVQQDEKLVNEVAVHKVIRLVRKLEIVAERSLPVVPSLDKVTVRLVLYLLLPVFFQVFELSALSEGLYPLLDLLAPLGMNKCLSFQEKLSVLLIKIVPVIILVLPVSFVDFVMVVVCVIIPIAIALHLTGGLDGLFPLDRNISEEGLGFIVVVRLVRSVVDVEIFPLR